MYFSHRKRIRVGLFSSAIIAVITSEFASAQQDVQSMGTLGGMNSFPSSKNISADGRVIVGYSNLANGDTHAFRWTEAIAMQDLGTLGGNRSRTGSISADGRVIVGDSRLANGDQHAFQWTEVNGMQDLGTLGGKVSDATAVSADGSVIVGYSWLANGDQHAFRWTEANAMQDLGTLGGTLSNPTAISADGRVIVGYSELVNGDRHAFRWTGANAMQDLGTLGGNLSDATAVSADGRVIAGYSKLVNGDQHAFRWTEANAMQDLGTLGGTLSNPIAISADGRVIAGYSKLVNGDQHAFRWTEANAMQDLGTLGGNESIARHVSADGNIIVGDSKLANGDQHAFRWTEANAMQDLGTLGGDRSSATSISADGNVIAGFSTTTEGDLRAVLWKLSSLAPPKTPTLIDVNNTIRTVASTANDTFKVLEMQRRGLSRLQNGCSINEAEKTCYDITTDVDGFSGGAELLSRISVGRAFTDQFSAGFSISHSLWRDLPGGFERNSSSNGAGFYGKWKQDIARGSWYLRGSVSANRSKLTRTRPVLSSTEAGTGNSIINGWSTSFELGRNYIFSAKEGVGFYGGLRYSDLSMNGYTENNVVFPVVYSRIASKQTTSYAGVNYAETLGEKLEWSVNFEIEKDITHKEPEFIASTGHIGSLKVRSNPVRVRTALSSPMAYAIKPDIRIHFTPHIARASTRDTAFGALIGITGEF